MEEKDRSDQELVLTDGSAEAALVAERIAAAAYEPPSTLRTGVWLRINAERKRRRIDYVPERDHDYSVEKPETREIRPGHLVYCSPSEYERYRRELDGAE